MEIADSKSKIIWIKIGTGIETRFMKTKNGYRYKSVRLNKFAQL